MVGVTLRRILDSDSDEEGAADEAGVGNDRGQWWIDLTQANTQDFEIVSLSSK